MDPDSGHSIDNTLNQLRSRSPLVLLASILVGMVIVAIAVNVVSGVLYDALLLLCMPGAEPDLAAQFRLDLLLGAAAVLIMIPCIVYLWKLSDQQAPQIQQEIVFVLPFANERGHTVLKPIESLAAHKGLEQALDWAVQKGAKAPDHLEWDGNWDWKSSGSNPSFHGDAVTILFDLVEWAVIRELDKFGKHLGTSGGMHRPGDDLVEASLPMEDQERSDTFWNVRPNYLWLHGNQAKEQKLKLPQSSHIRFRPVAMNHGVKKYGKVSVRKIAIENPGGTLTISPSQIWRRVTRPQYNKMIQKLPGMPEDVYPLEIRLLVTVKLKQWGLLWPWSSTAPAYQRWLLELQAQMVRHMDMERFIESDYRRMLVDIRDAVLKTN